MRRIYLMAALIVVQFQAGQLMSYAGAAGVSGFRSQGGGNVVSVVGEIVSVDRESGQVVVKTDQGSTTVIRVTENTSYLKVPAGEATLAKAVTIQFDSMAVGDRVLGRGQPTADKQQLLAQRMIVLTKAEIEKKREQDLREWAKRGVAGVVKGIDPQTGEIQLETRGAAASANLVVVTATTKCTFLRYAHGSSRFADATPSAFGDLKVGDQARVLVDGGADGKQHNADVIVFGSFRTLGAAVSEVNVQRGEIKVTRLDNKQPMLISIGKDSAIHRIPPQLAAVIAQRALSGRPGTSGGGGQPGASGGGTASSQQAKPTQTGAGANPGSGKVSDVQQMIDALPDLTIADLKAGDVIAVTCSVEGDKSKVTALKLVAGIEAVLNGLKAAPGKRQTITLTAGLPSVFDFSVVNSTESQN
jgi:hypothetical protein